MADWAAGHAVAAPVLQITDLHTEIRLKDATVRAVDGVSLSAWWVSQAVARR
jgi:hypothetical protein